MELTILGAAREVTGSCYLFEIDKVRFLVDCGMVQGGHNSRERNHDRFDFDPKKIDFVLLTHAHIDHSGLLPKLTASGFAGPIYMTAATAELVAILLPDSAHIQEMDTQRELRRKNQSSHTIPPLYTMEDVSSCLQQIRPILCDNWLTPHPLVTCRFRDAGHILGSAIIEIKLTQESTTRTIVVSGDLGQPGRPILRDPTPIEEADILLIESTYGNRLHKDLPGTLDELVQVVNDTLYKKKGNVIIPAFAVGRTQELIYYLHLLTKQGRLNHLNIYVDSPMATAVTSVTKKHLRLFDEEAHLLADWHALGKDIPNLHFVADVSESMKLNQVRSGAIIISASGMCDAGRIKHHLRYNLPRPECSILISGYQANGTLGRRLVDGDKEVKIFDEEIQVRASIHTLGGFSAHADQKALLDWVSKFKKPPTRTFVIHGEEDASNILAERLQEQGLQNVVVPKPNQKFTL